MRHLGVCSVLLVCSVAACAPPPSRAVRAPITRAAATAPPVQAVAGDPDDAALADARLRPSTCAGDDVAQKALTEERVASMRVSVAKRYAEWQKKADAPCGSTTMWGDTIGEAFGAGGLGLSGTGEGGGGFGHVGGSAPQALRDATKTNNQVAGVDEADLVKNDGTYIYLATGRALRIVRADQSEVVSKTVLSGFVRQLFVLGNRVVAYVSSAPKHQDCTYGYDCQLAGDGSSTDVVVFDVADRAHPRVVRTLQLSGSLIAARRIGDTVHTVLSDGDAPPPLLPEYPDGNSWCGKNADAAAAREAWDALALANERLIRASVSTYPTLTEGTQTQRLCNVLDTPLADGKAFTTILSFDLAADAKPIATRTIRSRPGTVFASESALYVAVRHELGNTTRGYGFYEDQNEVTDLHKFRLGGSPEATQYAGSGVVAGHVLNQFSMDEWNGALRVATTRGRVPDPKVESAVSMFVESARGNLLRVGAIQHLARGEDIRAVRFDDDRGYVVTFKKTDPLFVLDLAHASAPRVLGELKIPGFSTYLHRIDPVHLLSIGYAADDHGSFAYFGGLLLQLFDVTDPLQPRLLHREKIGSRGTSSEAAGNHLAFNYDRGRNLLAIPATVCGGGSGGIAGDRLTFSGLLVYEASTEKGFHRLGGVDHGTAGASCNAWWSRPSSLVKRSLFMEDRVYSIADDRMQVQSLQHLGVDVARVALQE